MVSSLFATLLPIALLAQARHALAQLPVDTVYGVNLGSWLLIEPYMLPNEWKSMGGDPSCSCGDSGCVGSEWDLTNKIGQDAANSAFQKHWGSWFTQDDANAIKSAGLNTVRIPIGHWIVEDTKNDNDKYPEGGFQALTTGLGWLADAGINVLLDIHAVPGQSVANNAFSGRCNPNPSFFQNSDTNFQRAAAAASNLTESAHKINEWRTVFAIEALNEPPQDVSKDPTPNYDQYMDQFTSAVRDKESSLGISGDKALTLSFMDFNWQFGSDHVNPADHTSGKTFYDNHLYFSFGGVAPEKTQDSYLNTACSQGPSRASEDKNSKNSPLVFGEYWLSAEDGVPTDDQFYKDFSDALRVGFEQQGDGNGGSGWIFWAWKFESTNPQQAYKDALSSGFMPKNAADKLNANICDGRTGS